MNPVVIITSINSTLATFFFWNCLKVVTKNKKKLNICLTTIFLITYSILFYIVLTSSQSEIKNWYMIDSIMSGIAGLGFLVILYNAYKRLKHTLKRRDSH